MENGDKLWGLIYEELRGVRRDLDGLRQDLTKLKTYSDACDDERDSLRSQVAEMNVRLRLIETSKAKFQGLALGLGVAGGTGAGALLKFLTG